MVVIEKNDGEFVITKETVQIRKHQVIIGNAPHRIDNIKSITVDGKAVKFKK